MASDVVFGWVLACSATFRYYNLSIRRCELELSIGLLTFLSLLVFSWRVNTSCKEQPYLGLRKVEWVAGSTSFKEMVQKSATAFEAFSSFELPHLQLWNLRENLRTI